LFINASGLLAGLDPTGSGPGAAQDNEIIFPVKTNHVHTKVTLILSLAAYQSIYLNSNSTLRVHSTV
jgi:hypothetical protein